LRRKPTSEADAAALDLSTMRTRIDAEITRVPIGSLRPGRVARSSR
jgi:hypothetical protein